MIIITVKGGLPISAYCKEIITPYVMYIQVDKYTLLKNQIISLSLIAFHFKSDSLLVDYPTE